MAARRKVDYDKVEKLYRAGRLSNAEIARQCDCSEGMIRKKAKAMGWTRDLSQKVRDRAKAKLSKPLPRATFESTNSDGGTQADGTKVRMRTAQEAQAIEEEAVEEQSEAIVDVVRRHRSGLTNGQNLVETLFLDLRDSIANREQIEDAIQEETRDDKETRRRNMMLRAVSLPGNAGTLRDLAQAQQRFITLERQAWNIDEESKSPEEALSDEDLEARIAALDRQIQDFDAAKG